jgi:hypothetical protein
VSLGVVLLIHGETLNQPPVEQKYFDRRHARSSVGARPSSAAPVEQNRER